MEGKIALSARERKLCLRSWRAGSEVSVARRSLVLLRLDAGVSYREICRTCHVSSDFIAGLKRRYRKGGVGEALNGSPAATASPWWVIVILGWMRNSTPQTFGFFRTRWTCSVLAVLLWAEQHVRLSEETIRRQLHRHAYVWRRPRPVVGPVDPDYDAKLRRIQRLLATLPDDETAVFQDEVDVNLNPKIGPMWMPCGEQAEVTTPGNNVKRYVSGSLVWRTNTLIVSPPGPSRNSALFLAHLDELRRRLRSSRRIHVICDNASCHKSKAVREYLEQWSHRIVVHFLPTYAPETNPIERVWWHLHETITRNHCCTSIEELLTEAYDWFRQAGPFTIETSLYQLAA